MGVLWSVTSLLSLLGDEKGGHCNKGMVFEPVIRYLEQLGYREGVDLMAAPYDWRRDPFSMSDTFEEWMRMIEDLDTRGTGVVVLAHSMGNNMFAYFVRYAIQRSGPG